MMLGCTRYAYTRLAMSMALMAVLMATSMLVIAPAMIVAAPMTTVVMMAMTKGHQKENVEPNAHCRNNEHQTTINWLRIQQTLNCLQYQSPGDDADDQNGDQGSDSLCPMVPKGVAGACALGNNVRTICRDDKRQHIGEHVRRIGHDGDTARNQHLRGFEECHRLKWCKKPLTGPTSKHLLKCGTKKHILSLQESITPAGKVATYDLHNHE
jgi:hypothetical protein